MRLCLSCFHGVPVAYQLFQMRKRQEEYESDCAVNVNFDRDLSELEYKRYMGAYRPHFKSIPQDHYPPSWWDVILCTLILVVVVVGGLGLMIGFLIWDFVCGSTDFVLVWSIVLCVFTGIILLGVFIGGRAKISNQRRMIRDKMALLHVNSSLEQSK